MKLRNDIELELSKVIGELSVYYYDHKLRNKSSFVGFCTTVKYMMNNKNTYKTNDRANGLLLFLISELTHQYGITSDMAVSLIIDFFNSGVWLRLYEHQKKINDAYHSTGY